MAAPKKKRASPVVSLPYNPDLTSTGKRAIDAEDAAIDKQDEFRQRRAEMNRASPRAREGDRVFGVGSPAYERQVRPLLKRDAAAERALVGQDSGTRDAFAQHLGTPGGKPVAQPKKQRAASAVPPPAKIDPVTGRSLSRGNPVPAAYSGSPADRSGLFHSSALGAARATFKPPYLGAKGRVPDTPPAPRAVPDPVSGLPLKKGNPVHTAYSGDMNSRVALGLRTAGTAVGMAMKPPYLGAKGRVPNDTPAAIPPARAPQIPTVDSVSRAKPNSPGYEDFPQSLAPGKKKRTRP